jgi:hypothetical protein
MYREASKGLLCTPAAKTHRLSPLTNASYWILLVRRKEGAALGWNRQKGAHWLE